MLPATVAPVCCLLFGRSAVSILRDKTHGDCSIFRDKTPLAGARFLPKFNASSASKQASLIRVHETESIRDAIRAFGFRPAGVRRPGSRDGDAWAPSMIIGVTSDGRWAHDTNQHLSPPTPPILIGISSIL